MEQGQGALEASVVAKDGHLVPFYFAAIRFESQGQRYLMGTGTDISERKLAELALAKLMAQLQQTQKMDSLGSLAGGLAHDMNNVLAAILSLASANHAGLPEDSAAKRALGIIIQAAERGGRMVKSLLSFARQGPAEELEVNLNLLLQEEVRLLEGSTLAKVRLVLNLSPDLHPILGDASALTHAFMNLCVNAVDAMPEDGTLTLQTRNLEGPWVEVLVADTGTGMSRDVMDKALDPFFTTKEVGKGTGLGLSIVYRTVKAHQGELELLSEPGLGTQVKLRFPVSRGTSLVAPTPVGRSSVALLAGLKVLLIDDDDLIQYSLREVIEALGCQVQSAYSGEEALAALEAGAEPGLIILDLNMPGLGGAGTLPRLRALRPGLPILLSTGRVDQTALDLAAAHEGVLLLPKPFTMGELEVHLGRALGMTHRP